LKKRATILIYMDIIARLLEAPTGPTRLARACNIPYDRLSTYTSVLEARGLLGKELREGHEVFHATQEGYQLYLDWAKVVARLKT